jgi:hypothetical protein
VVYVGAVIGWQRENVEPQLPNPIEKIASKITGYKATVSTTVPQRFRQSNATHHMASANLHGCVNAEGNVHSGWNSV